MFNTEFNHLIPKDKAELDLYPEAHRAEIDEINDWVYDTVNSESLSPAFEVATPVLNSNCDVHPQTECTNLALQLPKRHTKPLSCHYSIPWTSSRKYCRARTT